LIDLPRHEQPLHRSHDPSTFGFTEMVLGPCPALAVHSIVKLGCPARDAVIYCELVRPHHTRKLQKEKEGTFVTLYLDMLK
jgi:hypothetical protein